MNYVVASSMSSPVFWIVYIVFLVALMYFMAVRPQKKQKKAWTFTEEFRQQFWAEANRYFTMNAKRRTLQMLSGHNYTQFAGHSRKTSSIGNLSAHTGQL